MTWITFGVHFLVIFWFLLDKPIDEGTPPIAAEVWKTSILILATLLGVYTVLSIIFSGNPATVEETRRISRIALPTILALRLNLLAMCLFTKLSNRDKTLQPIDKFRLANLPPPYNYQHFKEEIYKMEKAQLITNFQ